jgi:hypothetical protein
MYKYVHMYAFKRLDTCEGNDYYIYVCIHLGKRIYLRISMILIYFDINISSFITMSLRVLHSGAV